MSWLEEGLIFELLISCTFMQLIKFRLMDNMFYYMFNKNACLLFSYTCFISKRIQIYVMKTCPRFKCVKILLHFMCLIKVLQRRYSHRIGGNLKLLR